MRKNIVIVLLTIVWSASVAFGLYQKQVADGYALKASENEQRAREMAMKAEEHLRIVEQEVRIAAEKLMEAERQLQLAQSNKRK